MQTRTFSLRSQRRDSLPLAAGTGEPSLASRPRPLAQRADRHDDAEAKVRTFRVALAPPLLDLGTSFRNGIIAMQLDPVMSRQLDVEVGGRRANGKKVSLV